MTRQKVGGVNFSFFIVNHLPVLPPSAFSAADIAFIVPRVLELVYTAWDMRPLAEDVRGEATNDPSTSSGQAERRMTTDGGAVDRGEINDERDEDPSGIASADQQLQPHRKGLAMIRDEILRRNAECNVCAPADLFAPRDGFVLPPFRWCSLALPVCGFALDWRVGWPC